MCISDVKFVHDLKFYSIKGTLRDNLNFSWIERDTDVLITPSYYSVVNDHVDENIKFSWSGNKICFSNTVRDRMIDSLTFWQASRLKSKDSITELPIECGVLSFVLYNSSHEINLCSTIHQDTIEFKPVVYKRYCVDPKGAEWKFVQFSLEFKTYLTMISTHIKEEYEVFISHVKKEIGNLISYLFDIVYESFISLFEQVWSRIDAFNDSHYLFEYVIMFSILSYRSGSSISALSIIFLTVWSLGFARASAQ